MIEKKFTKGFGLLEVMVTCVIIIVVMASIVSIGRAALGSDTYTQQRAQAIFLGQEGIEMVRQIRDTNWIDQDNTTAWNTLEWNSTKTDLIDVDLSAASIRCDLISYKSGQLALANIASGSGATANACEGGAEGTTGSLTVNGTNYRRYIKVERYVNASNNSPIQSDATLPTLNSYSDTKHYYSLKITAVVAWGSTTVTDNNHKSVSVSEVLTDWRPNY